MRTAFFREWQSDIILILSLFVLLFTRINAVWLIVLGSFPGFIACINKYLKPSLNKSRINIDAAFA
jgi:hypothetical protein